MLAGAFIRCYVLTVCVSLTIARSDESSSQDHHLSASLHQHPPPRHIRVFRAADGREKNGGTIDRVDYMYLCVIGGASLPCLTPSYVRDYPEVLRSHFFEIMDCRL